MGGNRAASEKFGLLAAESLREGRRSPIEIIGEPGTRLSPHKQSYKALQLVSMALSSVSAVLGDFTDIFAAIGLLAVSLHILFMVLPLWRGLKAYVLGKTLGLGVNLKKTGQWAGEAPSLVTQLRNSV